jgi:hypothetical protein
MIEQALRDLIVANVTINALVSGRVYPVTAPQKPTFPLIVFNRISTERQFTHQGNAHLAAARFQFTAFATTPTQAKTLSAAIVSLFHGYQGTVGAEKIQKSEVVNEADEFELELGTYQAPVDVILTFVD